MEKTIKINLGSGKDYRDGYLNVDDLSMYKGKVDIKSNIKTFNYEQGVVDEILLCHVAMYIDTLEMPVLMKRWYSWLKPKGRLIIETGDLKKICKTILESNDPQIINGTNGVMQLFGWGDTKGHTWAWCEKTLKDMLWDSGFRIAVESDGGLHNRPERDITIIAVK